MEAEYNREIALIEANTVADTQIIDATADAEARRLRAIGERQAIEEIIDLVGPEGWETFYRMQKLKEIAQFLDNGEATVILPIDTKGTPALIVDNTPN
jgi:regulator of protease activity HflC (stomatin/prohibitin superfamily)